MTHARTAAPFPYAGGKSGAAPLVWRALGRVQNFVEPFAGSLAVLLSRPRECWATPDAAGTETVNDASRFVANFWRALAADPEGVARAADWPVNECDLHARHRSLVSRLPALAALLDSDPRAFDAEIAGWWCWGACCWIGSGWCDEQRGEGLHRKLPHLGDAGQGLHRKLPHLGDAGQGLHRKLPHLGDAGRGLHRKLPHLGDAGRGDLIRDYLTALSARIRDVRVACGDWSRVTGDCVTWRHGTTGVLLDPPYGEGAWDYAGGGAELTKVQAWAVEAGKRRDMRVVLCGYEGTWEPPAGWQTVAWKARGGYGSQRRDGSNGNARRERLWLSPACLPVLEAQPSLAGVA